MQHKFTVTMDCTLRKKITVWANNEQEAERKASDVVMKWANVVDAEAEDCQREAP